jgi:hypothetical protein
MPLCPQGGDRYAWKLAPGPIPRDDAPARGIANEPCWQADYEALLTATLRRESDSGWRFCVRSRIGSNKPQTGESVPAIPAKEFRWLDGAGCTDGRFPGDHGTEALDPRGPIILPQYRRCDGCRVEALGRRRAQLRVSSSGYSGLRWYRT